MNGQTNENQPVRPDFSNSALPGNGTNPASPAPMGVTPAPIAPASASDGPAPAPFNGSGVGFNQPVSTDWSPNAVPTPGPMNATPSSVGSVPISSIPGVSGIAQTPAPTSMSAAPVPPMAPASRPISPPPVSGFGGPAASVPPPTASQYEVRTMNTDSSALKASGGMETAPKMFSPAPMGEEAFFSPTTVQPSAKKKGGNKIILVVVILIILGALGFLGYKFAWPLIVSPVSTPEPLPTPTPPEPEPEPEPTPVTTHSSLFIVTPADSTEENILETVTAEFIKALFPAGETSGVTIGDGMIRELVINTAEGPLTFPSFITAMLSEINAPGIEAAFEDDFTLFVYKDGVNDLPGFIAKVKPEAAASTLDAVSTALEASPNLKNFYLTDPGTISAFRAGTVGVNPIRYATFTTAGYAFNYGWFKNVAGDTYLIAASSYKGITEAAKRAGF